MEIAYVRLKTSLSECGMVHNGSGTPLIKNACRVPKSDSQYQLLAASRLTAGRQV